MRAPAPSRAVSPTPDSGLTAARSGVRGSPAAIVAVGVLLLLAIRSQLLFDDVAQPDIAGILYNADLLRTGGLPYVDSQELKQPLSFFVAAAAFAAFGRSVEAVHLAYVLWIGLGALAVALAARVIHRAGPRPHAATASHAPALASATAAALWLPLAAQFDFNYSAWMTVPYAAAFAALLRACAEPEARGRALAWHGLAGLFGMLAVATKAHAVVLAPVFVVTWIWGRARGARGATCWAPVAWLAGAAVALAPLVALYAARGEFAALLASRLGLAQAGGYAAVEIPGAWPWLLGQVAWQHLVTFPLGTALLLVACGEALLLARERMQPDARDARGGPQRPRASELGALVPVLALWAMSVVGCGLGGRRFYGHYLIQYLPALVLLVAWPPLRARLLSGPRTAVLAARAGGSIRIWTWVARAAVVGALVFQLGELAVGRGHRYDSRPRYRGEWTAAQIAGEFIRTRSGPADTIYGWGYGAWPVYFWAERRAPTPIYKSLGLLTTYNTNTAFHRGQQIHGRRGPALDRVMAAFEGAPPRFVVLSNAWDGSDYDPMLDLPELVAVLERGYRLAFTVGGLRVLQRVDDDHSDGARPEP